MPELYIDLAIPVAVDKLFTYKVPAEMQSMIRPGVRVIAPFGNQTVVGFIVDIKKISTIAGPRPIKDVLDVKPLLSEDMFNLAKWIAEYYFAPLGEVLKSMVIQGSARPPRRIVRLREINTEEKSNSLKQKQKAVLQVLHSSKSLSVAQLQNKIGSKNINTLLADLADRGLISITEAAVRADIKPKTQSIIEINPESNEKWMKWLGSIDEREKSKRLTRQIAVITDLLQSDTTTTSIPVITMLKKVGVSLSTIRTLAEKKLITIGKREIIRTPEFEVDESSLKTQNIILNSYQQKAFEKIVETVNHGIYHTFLLHGVTGSGKTQVYIETIKETIKRGRKAIVLVPEIALTPQTVRRFKVHFGERVAVLHSRISLGERYDTWRLCREGKFDVVVGPRSAIFAPLNNIGLIVVDEEQESSYKQFDQTPRYHARDVAIIRASYCKAVVVLGSATPSLESYANAVNGKYTLLELPERIDDAKLPDIQILDMTKERADKLGIHREQRREDYKKDPKKAKLLKKEFEFGSISDLLKEKIGDRLKKGEGIILLQNRRGFAPFIECPDCGHVEMCDHCNISLTYHSAKEHLRCHYCGMVKRVPIFCTQCQSLDIQYRGFGTQRVEEELAKFFPTTKLLRMDLDTTSTKGAHDKLLNKFGAGDADILLGTQMVAKGLDFSRVTLVGVISADTQMLLPDFRSSEKTFQLLTQVAGRAGRSNLAGEVVIQTYQPKHPSLQHVLLHDFKGFYEEELAFRKELQYPPFSRLILIEFKGKRENEVIDHADKFAELLKKGNSHFITLGPAAAALTRLKNFFRWHIVIKSVKSNDPSGKFVHSALHRTVQSYRNLPLGNNKNVKMIIDVDPVGMM